MEMPSRKLRINSESDIPQFLLNSVVIVNNTIHFVTLDDMCEKHETAPIGSTLEWNSTELTRTGYYLLLANS